MFSVLIGITFHGGEKSRIAVFVGSPCWYYAPKVHSPIITDLPHNDFYFSTLNDCNDAPVSYWPALPDTFFVALDVELFYSFLKLLIGCGEANKFDRERQELESQDLR